MPARPPHSLPQAKEVASYELTDDFAATPASTSGSIPNLREPFKSCSTMAYNKTEHLRRNIEAIRTAFALEREQRAATPEGRDVLRAYSGFGAIKEVLEPLPHKGNGAHAPDRRAARRA